ncbi:monovalent cation/H+ antiporter subunit A [Niveibacterium sp. 24ML]|uniref:monovalent cation/H+ antiporter subunit A n=1 Tax=Niveibacterium sp. 24ML TaxID=2985512 RepID=UPI0022710358|nr:monovalent cation/H+ antiporter subunit A [Niveibacterium sp. 24ML]MCX9157980.1 monovalent cation/H+ antiporter subunit A [Niveibacterium sp. 24ML]
MTLLTICLLPWCAALLLARLRSATAAFALAGACALVVLGLLGQMAQAVWAGQTLQSSVAWLPALGVSATLRIDALAWLFATLVSGIGALVILYARYYMDGDERLPRFFALLCAFMGAMLGVVLAGDLVLLAMFWELTSLASFLLIAFNAPDRGAVRGARAALAVTGMGGLALMAAVVMLGRAAGSFDLATVLAAGDVVRADPRYPWILTCFLLAVFSKSAQFPFQFWLARAMAAPTPVSAYLHSATLVKAGIFLLLRFYPVLGGTDAWFFAVSTAGAITLLLGGVAAVFQHDLKGLLAYSTVSHLGLITLLIGFSTPTAIVAAVFHVINHATFKASLFMAAGIVDHECGTRDLRNVNGMWRYMPLTGSLAIVAAAAMAGVPLLNGFLSKEMFFGEALALEGHDPIALLAPLAALLAGAAGVAYSARFVHDVFFNGAPINLPRTPHEPPLWMAAPVAVLVLLCLLVGLIPTPIIGAPLAAAAHAALGGSLPSYSLALWHGFNGPLAMSALALVSGVGIYAVLMRKRALHQRPLPDPWGYRQFERLLLTLARSGVVLVRQLRGDRMRLQMAVLALAAVLAAGWPLLGGGFEAHLPELTAAIPQGGIIVWVVGAVFAIAATSARNQPVTVLLFLGAVGLAVALAFAGLSAPDLSLTQLFVEVATVLLLLLALQRLPVEAPPVRSLGKRLRYAAIAVAGGGGTGWLAWEAMLRKPPAISDYQLANAVSGAGGTNAVNVIIVDFRGFDTLGEITVLAAAALIVWAFLARERAGVLGRFQGSFMLPTAVKIVMPFAALVAVHLYLRGHNLPGGGFVAGLLLAIGLVLEALALGSWRSPHARPVRWLAAGLGLALLTGAASLALGYPFLTSAFGHPVLPVLGEIPLASAALFDLGVLAVVVGATVMLILAFAFGREEGKK